MDELSETFVELGPARGQRVCEGSSAAVNAIICGVLLHVWNPEARRRASLYSAVAFACNASGLRSMFRKWLSNMNFWTVRRPRHSIGRGCCADNVRRQSRA